MARIRKTGKSGGLTYDGVVIPFTSWELTLKSETKQVTDTGDFDAGTGQTWEASVYGFRSAEVSIEANFDLNATSTDVVEKFLNNDDALEAVFKVDATTTFGYGDIILEEVKVTTPVDDAIKFTATGRTSGTFTLGAP